MAPTSMPASTGSQSHSASHQRSAPQPMMWSASSSSLRDDRHRYASSKQAPAGRYSHNGSSQQGRFPHHAGGTSSSSSTSNYTVHGSSSYSQPSPSSSSVTSTSSSLRTPPDLLINGAAVASSVSLAAGVKGVRGFNGKGTAIQHLSISQLEDRLKLLDRVPKDIFVSDLPSPPSSPRAPVRGLPSSEIPRESKKRKASDAVKTAAAAGAKESRPELRRQRRRSSSPSSVASKPSPGTNSSNEEHPPRRHTGRSENLILGKTSLPLPPVRHWTRELYFETAAAYRGRGRKLKHQGDGRMRDASSPLSSTSPRSAMLTAALEHTDALLLYTYGFWCEDQGSGMCVAHNWESLFGLLKHVKASHDRGKMFILSSVCRLLEACVLRHLAAHEMLRLQHRLSKSVAAAAAAAGPASTASPPDAHAPATSDKARSASSISFAQRSSEGSQGNADAQASAAATADMSHALNKVVAQQDRSSRLYEQARTSVLSLAALQDTYPRLAKICLRSQRNAQWISADPADLASRLDPSSHGDAPEAGWLWPIDVSIPFPVLVCFGRALLREAAREHGVPFDTEPVDMSPRTSARAGAFASR